MCGIVGLFLKHPAWRPQLGAHLAAMLGTMRDRGPDSAGFAVYGAAGEDVKLTMRAPGDLAALAHTLGVVAEIRCDPCGAARQAGAARGHPCPSRRHEGDQHRRRGQQHGAVQGGRPAGRRRARASACAAMSGTHGIGHTRMATESAVTTDGAHPFSTGRDQCLVHNGIAVEPQRAAPHAACARASRSRPRTTPKSPPAI